MPRPPEDHVLESITTLAEAALALNILESHKRDVINMALWKVTEARGKYTTRFRSTGAMNAPKGTKLQHEHVIPRKDLIDAIMLEPSRTRGTPRVSNRLRRHD